MILDTTERFIDNTFLLLVSAIYRYLVICQIDASNMIEGTDGV